MAIQYQICNECGSRFGSLAVHCTECGAVLQQMKEPGQAVTWEEPSSDVFSACSAMGHMLAIVTGNKFCAFCGKKL